MELDVSWLVNFVEKIRPYSEQMTDIGKECGVKTHFVHVF